MNTIESTNKYNPFAAQTGAAPTGSGTEDFAQLLKKLQQAQAAPNQVALAEPEQDTGSQLEIYQEQLRTLRKQLDKVLAAHHIDTGGAAVSLQLNVLQELTASGSHPQLEQIQAALQEHPELQALFQQVAQLAESAAAQQGASFQHGDLKLPVRFRLQLEAGQYLPSVN